MVKLLPSIVAPELTGLMKAVGRFGSDSRRLQNVSRNGVDLRGFRRRQWRRWAVAIPLCQWIGPDVARGQL